MSFDHSINESDDMAQVSSLSSKNLCREFWQAVNKGVIMTNWKKKILVCFYNVENISATERMLKQRGKEVLT